MTIGQEELPLKLEDDLFDEKLVQQMDGKSRNDIYSLVNSHDNNIPKSSVDIFLKVNFKRVKTK